MNIGEAYERWQGEMNGYFTRHFGEKELAQDAVQQAFSKAIFSLPHIEHMPEAALRSWLYAAARNAAIDMLRKRRPLAYGFDFDLLPAPLGADAADIAVLEEEIEKLREVHRQVVRLRYYQGHNASEIGGILGMPASTVRYHLMRALRQLRKELGKDEDK